MKGRQHQLGFCIGKAEIWANFLRLEIGSLDLLLVTGAVSVAVRDV
jgi:hypothetical protein